MSVSDYLNNNKRQNNRHTRVQRTTHRVFAEMYILKSCGPGFKAFKKSLNNFSYLGIARTKRFPKFPSNVENIYAISKECWALINKNVSR